MATRSSKTTAAERPDSDLTGPERVTARAAAAAAAVAGETWGEDSAEATEPASAPPAATVVTETAVVAGPELKKKELIDRVVARSGQKKREVKPVVEAMLEELGAAVLAGEELNLPPLGKLKITRSKELANARVFHCRLRQTHGGVTPAPDPLAEDEEEG